MIDAVPDVTITREIERRFLVPLDVAREHAVRTGAKLIEQTYLPGTGDWQIRSRRIETFEGESFLLTMKRHVSRGECDEIELGGSQSAHKDFILAGGAVLIKERTCHPLACGSTLELDIYFDQSLVPDHAVAEIEVASIDQEIALPDWIGREITGEKEFSNHALFCKLMEKEETC